MTLKVMDGARTLDGANSTPDLPHEDQANTTVNTTGFDMNDFMELLVNVNTGVVDASQVGGVYVQESNDNSTFANISGASVAWNGASSSNLSDWISVNWKHPDRKRYARLSGVFGATNSAAAGAVGLRVQPKGGPVSADGSMTAA